MSTESRMPGLTLRNSIRDDRVLLETRWLGRILVPALAVAAIILFGYPGRTTELFAWTIRPDMTPIVMGAGYATGAYFFTRVATIDRWHEVAIVFPGIAAFTWFMGIATGLHWANFNHDHVTFYIWTFLYIVAPVLVPVIWYRNRQTDSGESASSSVRLPRIVQWVAGATGLVITVLAVALFVVPEYLIAVWPWTVSPLTARILLGWFALFGVVNLGVALDDRWSAARVPAQTEIIGFGLVLIGAVRAWDDFDFANPLAWGFIGGFAVYVLALLALYGFMETR